MLGKLSSAWAHKKMLYRRRIFPNLFLISNMSGTVQTQHQSFGKHSGAGSFTILFEIRVKGEDGTQSFLLTSSSALLAKAGSNLK